MAMVDFDGRYTWTKPTYLNNIQNKYYRVGSRGTEIAQLQKDLTAMGYSTKGVDGIFGNNTKNAVIAFQRAHGLTADGIAGPKTLEELAYSKVQDRQTGRIVDSVKLSRNISMGSKGQDVKDLQSQLSQLGFYKSSLDGIFGQNTRAAVINFQKSRHITADGIAGSQTKKELAEAIKEKNQRLIQERQKATANTINEIRSGMGITGIDPSFRNKTSAIGYDAGYGVSIPIYSSRRLDIDAVIGEKASSTGKLMNLNFQGKSISFSSLKDLSSKIPFGDNVMEQLVKYLGGEPEIKASLGEITFSKGGISIGASIELSTFRKANINGNNLEVGKFERLEVKAKLDKDDLEDIKEGAIQMGGVALIATGLALTIGSVGEEVVTAGTLSPQVAVTLGYGIEFIRRGLRLVNPALSF